MSERHALMAAVGLLGEAAVLGAFAQGEHHSMPAALARFSLRTDCARSNVQTSQPPIRSAQLQRRTGFNPGQ